MKRAVLAVLVLFATMFAAPAHAVDPPPKVIGMSAPSSLWSQRLSEVGACGIEARRIYADLSSAGATQRNLIGATIAAGMTPVVSFKVPSFTTAGSGAYNAWADKAADQLDAYGVRILVGVWHEPSDDMTGPQFLAMEHQLIPRFDRPNLRTFAINHGWLLDNQVAKFSTYADDALLNELDYYGIDTYQSGTMSNPGSKEPHHRIAALTQWLTGQGHRDMPIVIGEYSAYTAAAMTRAGEAILSTPSVAYALEFNSQTGGKGVPLTGSRLAAFQNTKADARALHDPSC